MGVAFHYLCLYEERLENERSLPCVDFFEDLCRSAEHSPLLSHRRGKRGALLSQTGGLRLENFI